MFRPTKAKVSCSSLSTSVTCEHVSSALPSTCLQSIGRGRRPGEPVRSRPETPGPAVSKDPEVGDASHGAVLLGTPMRPSYIRKPRSEPPVSLPSWGLSYPVFIPNPSTHHVTPSFQAKIECIPLCVPGSSFTHKVTNSGINIITSIYYIVSNL
jgi:hypothetical protein